MWWDYWPMPFFGPFFMIIIVVLCIGMMMFMMRGHRHGGSGGDALDILKERYARGDINQAEYEERRRVLRS